MNTGGVNGGDRWSYKGEFPEEEPPSDDTSLGFGARILYGVGAFFATACTLGIALASPAVRDLWYSAFTGRVQVIKKEDHSFELPTKKADAAFKKTVTPERKEPDAPTKPEVVVPPNTKSEDVPPVVPETATEKKPDTLFKSDEEIKQEFAIAVAKPQTGETKIFKARLCEIIDTYYKAEASQVTEAEWERSVELFAKIYNMIKQSYGQIVTNPNHNILQRTDKFVCLEDEDINGLKKEKQDKGELFTLANTWRELLWLAFANVQPTPIPGIKIKSNMYNLRPEDMAKLFHLALEVANKK